MRQCELRDTYLDAGLSPAETAAFEKHLCRCRECSDWVTEWRIFERGVNRWANAIEAPPVTSGEAASLMRRAEDSRQGVVAEQAPNRRAVYAGLAAAVAACATVILVVSGILDAPPHERDAGARDSNPVARAVVKGTNDEEISLVAGEDLVAPSNRPVTAVIDKDAVALSSRGRIRLIRLNRGQVRLGLESGTVACRVDKRLAGENFVVEAGDYTVRVVGTRFSVSRDTGDINVVVQEGVVRVEQKGGRHWMLSAGETLNASEGHPMAGQADADSLRLVDALFDKTDTVERVASPKPVPGISVDGDNRSSETTLTGQPVDDADRKTETPEEHVDTPAPTTKPNSGRPVANIAGWRQMVVDGRAEAARREMRAYLKSSPNDSRVLALYADAARKSRALQEAVRAYRKVIEIGEDAEASRAMYMLGSMYQSPLKQHGKAVEMLRAYKKSGRVSKEQGELIDVKIAKSLVALGECDAARKAVAHLLIRSGSFVVENARKMIESCGRDADTSNAP